MGARGRDYGRYQLRVLPSQGGDRAEHELVRTLSYNGTYCRQAVSFSDTMLEVKTRFVRASKLTVIALVIPGRQKEAFLVCVEPAVNVGELSYHGSWILA